MALHVYRVPMERAILRLKLSNINTTSTGISMYSVMLRLEGNVNKQKALLTTRLSIVQAL